MCTEEDEFNMLNCNTYKQILHCLICEKQLNDISFVELNNMNKLLKNKSNDKIYDGLMENEDQTYPTEIKYPKNMKSFIKALDIPLYTSYKHLLNILTEEISFDQLNDHIKNTEDPFLICLSKYIIKDSSQFQTILLKTHIKLLKNLIKISFFTLGYSNYSSFITFREQREATFKKDIKNSYFYYPSNKIDNIYDLYMNLDKDDFKALQEQRIPAEYSG